MSGRRRVENQDEDEDEKDVVITGWLGAASAVGKSATLSEVKMARPYIRVGHFYGADGA